MTSLDRQARLDKLEALKKRLSEAKGRDREIDYLFGELADPSLADAARTGEGEPPGWRRDGERFPLVSYSAAGQVGHVLQCIPRSVGWAMAKQTPGLNIFEIDSIAKYAASIKVSPKVSFHARHHSPELAVISVLEKYWRWESDDLDANRPDPGTADRLAAAAPQPDPGA